MNHTVKRINLVVQSNNNGIDFFRILSASFVCCGGYEKSNGVSEICYWQRFADNVRTVCQFNEHQASILRKRNIDGSAERNETSKACNYPAICRNQIHLRLSRYTLTLQTKQVSGTQIDFEIRQAPLACFGNIG